MLYQQSRGELGFSARKIAGSAYAMGPGFVTGDVVANLSRYIASLRPFVMSWKVSTE